MQRRVWIGNVLGMLAALGILVAILNIICLPTWVAMLIGGILLATGSMIGGLAAYALGKEE
jgi:membrane-associated protease RseP (regulator of RpoE activity)